jgi:hypothetical protein
MTAVPTGRVRRATQCRSAVALAGTAVVSLLAGCSSTAAGPPPFSASPAPSVGTVVAPIPSSSPTTSASAPTPTASESRTSVTPSPPVTTPPTAGAIRTSYPGIKKLVIVKSRWNNTPAGRTAINTIALYNSQLVTSIASKSTTQLQGLAARGCTTCAADVARLDRLIDLHEHYAQSRPPVGWDSIGIFISFRGSDHHFVVSVDENAAPLTVRDAQGSVVSRSGAVAYRSTYTVGLTSAGYRILSYYSENS